MFEARYEHVRTFSARGGGAILLHVRIRLNARLNARSRLSAIIAAIWTREMEIRSIVDRFSQRELDIRRRCNRDAHFKSICMDYEEAAAALRHWQKAAGEGDRKVEEYTMFLGELETEILAQLDRPAQNARHARRS